MAATAVYVDIQRISEGGFPPTDGVNYSNIGATTAAFQLRGGKYGVSVVGSTFGTVTLQKVGPDGSTMLTALTAFAASGFATVELPQGLYKIAIA